MLEISFSDEYLHLIVLHLNVTLTASVVWLGPLELYNYIFQGKKPSHYDHIELPTVNIRPNGTITLFKRKEYCFVCDWRSISQYTLFPVGGSTG